MVLARGITADLSFRREYCERFSAIMFSIKVGAMLLTILNTSRAISFTLFICRYSALRGLEEIGVRGYIVIVDEPKGSLLDFLKLIGVALATEVPDQRAVIKI